MEHVQSKLDQADVADIITSQRKKEKKIAGSAGPSWSPVSVPAVFCFFVLAVAVDAT